LSNYKTSFKRNGGERRMRSKVILEEIPELKLPEKYNKNVNILNNSPVEDGGHSYK
jgi:hypothetical protein